MKRPRTAKQNCQARRKSSIGNSSKDTYSGASYQNFVSQHKLRSRQTQLDPLIYGSHKYLTNTLDTSQKLY